MEYEIADVLSFLEGLSKQREHHQEILREHDKTLRGVCGAGAKAGMLSTADVDKERERLNVQYWTETVPMVADYNKEHGTDIKPWSCVKLDGKTLRKRHPYFHRNSLAGYSIAVAIVYDESTKTHKPVYVGDPIRVKGNPHPVNWALFNTWKSHVRHLSKDWTWTPYAPKREFEINGEKFACPVRGVQDAMYPLKIDGTTFNFTDKEDRDRVRRTIRGLLMDASNK